MISDHPEGLTYNDDDHANGRLTPNKPRAAGEDENGHGDSDYGEIELRIMRPRRNDD